jgi:hypothetical protein
MDAQEVVKWSALAAVLPTQAQVDHDAAHPARRHR